MVEDYGMRYHEYTLTPPSPPHPPHLPLCDAFRSLEGYQMYALPRTEARGDGVACFVKEGIDVLDRQASIYFQSAATGPPTRS